MSPATWSRTQRCKNDAIVRVVIVALAVARRLPGWLLRAAGRALGVMAFAVAAGARRTALRNVEIAFPELSARARRARVRRAFATLGGFLGDTVALYDPNERAGLSFVGDGRAILEEAHRAGRGVVLITAHFGSWERLAASLVEQGFPLVTPVRRSYDPRLEARVHGPLRARRGVDARDRDDPATARALLRALGAGKTVGILIDLNTRVPSIEVPFFGRAAWTTTAPARLACATGAPIVAAFATERGIEVSLVRAPSARSPRAEPETIAAVTEACTAQVEGAIRRAPERWIWMHDRWGPRRPQVGPKHRSPPG
jgi:KDO2-lipid IV(A) lauroyltransferase